MEEVELIDEALVNCYNLQNRIATMLVKLSDIKEEKGIIGNGNDCLSKKNKSPKKRKVKDRKKVVINAKSAKKVANTNDDTKTITQAQEIQSQTSNERTEIELAHMFSQLNDSFIEGNTDAYIKSYNQQGEQFLRRKRNFKSRVKAVNPESESTDMLANLNDMIVQVNAETLTKKDRTSKSKKSKDKKTKVPDSSDINKSTMKPNTNVVSDLQVYTENLLKIKELKSRNSNVSDVESDDSGISSGLRSLQDISSTYAKIDKRFIEVKRSVESVVVGMKHVDEIINRQKGVFHINFACAENETFICRH